MRQDSTASARRSVAPQSHRAISALPLDAAEFELYRKKLFYKVRYHLGSSCPDIEDVVQESMFRFLLALQVEQIRNPDRIGAFLSGVCNNVIHEYKRRIWKEPVSDREPPPATGPYPERNQEAARETVKLVLVRLSQRDRELLRLFFLDERDKDEICREMGLSEVGFRVALCRLKKTFRDIHSNILKQNPSI